MSILVKSFDLFVYSVYQMILTSDCFPTITSEWKTNGNQHAKYNVDQQWSEIDADPQAKFHCDVTLDSALLTLHSLTSISYHLVKK